LLTSGIQLSHSQSAVLPRIVCVVYFLWDIISFLWDITYSLWDIK
jgi:hypothetical protein